MNVYRMYQYMREVLTDGIEQKNRRIEYLEAQLEKVTKERDRYHSECSYLAESYNDALPPEDEI